MATVSLPQHIIDTIAKMEVDALLEGLGDEELSKNPAFLSKVRQFLKDNDVVVTMETEGMQRLKTEVNNIPNLLEEMQTCL